MSNLSLLLFCLILGAFLKRIKDFPDNTPMVLNQFLIYISLPALALIYIPQITLSRELLFPVATSWLVLGFALLLIPLIGKRMGWSRETIGCLLLTAGLGNTSFVGFPVIEALYGADGLKIALMVDQPGSFVAVSTAGIIIACTYSSSALRKRDIFRKVMLFPPFITFLIALGMNLAGIEARGAALYVLERLGATLAPIALTSVGMQLTFSLKREDLIPLISGLSYKLLLAPALLSILFIYILGGSGLIVQVSIMEAAMAPMITGSILAIMYGLNPKLATQMVGIGVPLSFLTLYGWYHLLERIA